jgi:hypothetical protein
MKYRGGRAHMRCGEVAKNWMWLFNFQLRFKCLSGVYKHAARKKRLFKSFRQPAFSLKACEIVRL